MTTYLLVVLIVIAREDYKEMDGIRIITASLKVNTTKVQKQKLNYLL